MPRSQLYVTAPRDFVMPNFVDYDGRLQTRPADGLPFIVWPDGRWCGPANTFMRELLERGYSRRNGGGTLAVTAAQLSHLVRFCWHRNVDFLSITDNSFRVFVKQLETETKRTDPTRKRRNATSVIAVARVCLSFLSSVGRHAGDDAFVGPSGRIRATLVKYEGRFGANADSRGRSRTIYYWHHASFPQPEPLNRRLPIGSAAIQALRSAVAKISSTSHQRARRHAMLKLLEITGARRSEVALVTVESLNRAQQMEHPMLRLPTLKKRGGRTEHRFVPISHSDLTFLLQYCNVHRRSVIRRRLHGSEDHGLMLVSGTTGGPIQPVTVTQEVRRLADAAGISNATCPHMFRHRFLTKLFVALIEQHQIENDDEFRRLLIDGEELKRKVAEWTGHSNLGSLDRYITLAFDEVNAFKKVYDLTLAGLFIDSFLGTIDSELDAVSAGEQPLIVLGRLKKHLLGLKRDLSLAKSARQAS